MNTKNSSLKGLLILLLTAPFAATLTAQEQPPKNWFNLDAQQDSVNGVSTEKAYAYLKGKKSKTVLVAVIDSGIDILHEDLKGVIWVNEDEIPDNGIDDDNNGYVDDVHGWNFIGGKDGRNVDKDSYELVREYKRLSAKYEGRQRADLKRKERADFDYWQTVKEAFENKKAESASQAQFMEEIDKQLKRYNQLFRAYLETEEVTHEKIKEIETTDEVVLQGKSMLSNIFQNFGVSSLTLDSLIHLLSEDIEHVKSQATAYDLDFDPRDIVGDDPDKLDEVGYGNNDVRGMGTDNFHGTHVAGIIAAKRGNDLGIDGIADNVKIMAIRAVPDGDERDKDVANAIRYAVDNGAQVVNMSFGKGYSPHLAYVHSAIKYAAKKGVLLVHAAGNSASDNDQSDNFPNDKFGRKENWLNWVEVGASSWGGEGNYVGVFSNYGKESVDVFAPGVAIYSLAPNNGYANSDGTSMASPVTAGVAALLLSYFPHLKPGKIKDILIQSVRSVDGGKVKKPGSGEEVDFAELSVSGGIINAAEAVKMAESAKK